MKERDFLSLDDLSSEELRDLLTAAQHAKKDPARWRDRIAGKQVALIFEKPSTRTRVSFETAVETMGGHAIVLRGDELQLGRGETIEDTGRVLSRYVDAIVIRTFGQDRLERLAEAATVPVVNALSDFSHPCQGVADLQTIEEKLDRLKGVALAYVGDGNNVAHSLMFGGAKMGMDIRIACPEGFEPLPQVVDRCQEICNDSGGRLFITRELEAAAKDANVLYTDVWVSMGQEDEAEDRTKLFADYQINDQAIAEAASDAIVMHCLPAHRGEEISASAIDGPRSVVWDQAENRMHAQKAILSWLMVGV